MIRPPTDFSTYPEGLEQSINQLPADCMKVICQFLSVRDILEMEKLNQHNRSSDYIKFTWKRLCDEEKIKVNWSKLFGRQNDPSPEKFTYRTEMALQYFLDDRRTLLLDHRRTLLKDVEKKHELKEKIERIEHCFKSVDIWNSFLATYISNALQKIKGNFLLENHNLEVALNENKMSLHLNSDYGNFGDLLQPGELLLQGLSHLANYDFQVGKDFVLINSCRSHPQICFAHIFLKSALQKNILHTSLLARKIVLQNFTSDLKNVLEDLAMFSAGQKDYQPLEDCLKDWLGVGDNADPDYFLNQLILLYKTTYPPMYIFRTELFIQRIFIGHESEYETATINATSCFQKGIQSYQQENSSIPGKVWLVGANLERIQEKWSEADAYMNCAMTAFDKSIPYKFWVQRAKIKEHLGDIEEALLSLKNIINSCERMSPKEGANHPHHVDDNFKIIYRVGKKKRLIGRSQLKFIEEELARLSAITQHPKGLFYDTPT